MNLPSNKTKIVATIGPASRSPEVLERMIRAGMNVARLNFSHGAFAEHGETIRTIRAAAQAVGRSVAILTQRPAAHDPDGNHRMEIIDLNPKGKESRV